MSKLWKCNFPGCTEQDMPGTKGWRRIECIPKAAYVLMAIPFVGSVLAIIALCWPDKSEYGVGHVCSLHRAQLFFGTKP